MYTFILITLGLLAILGIVVGVSNDAVNFLNSAFGSKAASRRVILSVASLGILLGVMTSSGMMEVARNGVFYPSQFTFEQIMTLFLGMMLGNIILLDIFNSLGLPTSTTVSLVFGLLGSAMAVALTTIWGSDEATLADLSAYINSGKAMAIISAILLSVAIAFVTGQILMFVSRLLFSFSYNRTFRRVGALWCGVTLAGIVYFTVFKGLSGSGIIPDAIESAVASHTVMSLLAVWLGSSAVLWLLQRAGVDILKVTILSGTFSLALAFAGNDLVNFIGVPLAGYDSYRLAMAAGDYTMTMESLAQPVRAEFWLMLAAGAVMVVTLFTSRKAMKVTQTELSLSNQNQSADERFGSTAVSRGLVRGVLRINEWAAGITPRRMREFIDSRFEPLSEQERSGAMYDKIRATVNLTGAAVLISLATSFQLPLSTTYVVFMVAMGSSLADRAWGRESAVYRITGVMTVITGWFVTALAGFVISLVVTMILIYGGAAAIIVAVAVCALMIVRSNFSKREESAEVAPESKMTPEIVRSPECALIGFTEHVLTTMETVTRIYDRTIVAVFKENRKVLKDMVRESETLYQTTRKQKYELMPILNTIKENDINTGHYYVQVVDYISEASKALLHITRPCYEHIDNNHEGFSKEQIVDLKSIIDRVEQILDTVIDMLRKRSFDRLDDVLTMRDELFDRIDAVMKNQLRRMRDTGGSTSANMLFFNILGETKTMVLHSRNIMKSLDHFIDCGR